MGKTIVPKSTFLALLPSLLLAASPPPDTTRADAVPSTDSLALAFPGAKGPIHYETYGKFENLGTPHYRFTMTDRPGLAKAVGEGIYPNQDEFKDPTYQKLQKDGKLAGTQWRFVDT